MPIVQTSQSIAAGGTLKVMADSIYETLPFHAKLEFAALGSATGLLMSISSGSDILAEQTQVGVGTGANVLPKYPDEFYLQDVAARGEKIKFTITNPTGGALTANAVVRLTPIG
jgi:hypothetical protein